MRNAVEHELPTTEGGGGGTKGGPAVLTQEKKNGSESAKQKDELRMISGKTKRESSKQKWLFWA